MRIWIDLTNSPHINFFKPFINKWKKEGHELILTARNLGNTIDLIEQNRWSYKEVGGHAGKNKLKKMLYFPFRVIELRKYLKKLKPDIGISQSSFYSPVVGKLLGFPTIYLNDNEHAKGNMLAFRFATLNIVPEFIMSLAESNGWNNKYKLTYYPGIKEGIYLSQSDIKENERSTELHQNHIYIRLEPWTAQYYKGKSQFMDDLILRLKNDYKITILPRGAEQAKHYKTSSFAGVDVADKPIPLENVYKDCSLFIGAGGSMTRELAFLGIPTLSVYQDELLEVDKYLISKNIMHFHTNPSVDFIKEILNKKTQIEVNELYGMGVNAFNLINRKVKEYAKN